MMKNSKKIGLLSEQDLEELGKIGRDMVMSDEFDQSADLNSLIELSNLVWGDSDLAKRKIRMLVEHHDEYDSQLQKELFLISFYTMLNKHRTDDKVRDMVHDTDAEFRSCLAVMKESVKSSEFKILMATDKASENDAKVDIKAAGGQWSRKLLAKGKDVFTQKTGIDLDDIKGSIGGMIKGKIGKGGGSVKSPGEVVKDALFHPGLVKTGVVLGLTSSAFLIVAANFYLVLTAKELISFLMRGKGMEGTVFSPGFSGKGLMLKSDESVMRKLATERGLTAQFNESHAGKLMQRQSEPSWQKGAIKSK